MLVYQRETWLKFPFPLMDGCDGKKKLKKQTWTHHLIPAMGSDTCGGCNLKWFEAKKIRTKLGFEAMKLNWGSRN